MENNTRNTELESPIVGHSTAEVVSMITDIVSKPRPARIMVATDEQTRNVLKHYAGRTGHSMSTLAAVALQLGLETLGVYAESVNPSQSDMDE